MCAQNSAFVVMLSKPVNDCINTVLSYARFWDKSRVGVRHGGESRNCVSDKAIVACLPGISDNISTVLLLELLQPFKRTSMCSGLVQVGRAQFLRGFVILSRLFQFYMKWSYSYNAQTKAYGERCPAGPPLTSTSLVSMIQYV